MTIGQLILILIGLYTAIGLAVALAFTFVGVKRLDTAAAKAPLRVRLLFIPGSVALWPIVLTLWKRASARPRPNQTEANA